MHWQWGIGGLNKRTLTLLTIAAITIRLLVMPVTLHGDVFHIWGVVTLSLKGIWDPFYYAVANYQNIASSTFDVYYPPAAYVIYSIFLIILHSFSSTLVGWLQLPRELVLLAQDVPLSTYMQDLGRSDLFWNIFLLKTPNLVYEVLILWCLAFLISKKYKKTMLVLWIFNPVVFYSAYMMGQVDLLTTLLVVGATVMAIKNKRIISLTLLIVGTMVKVLPVVLIAPMAFLLGESWKQRIWLIVYSIAIFIIFNLPFTGDLERLRISYFPPIMPGLVDLSLRPDALVMAGKLLAAGGVGLWLATKTIGSGKRIKSKYYPEVMGLILLLFFSAYRGALFNHYVILMPFLILFWVKERRAVLKMIVFSGLLFLTHIYTRPLQGELFTPTGISWLINFPSSRELAASWFKYEHLSLLTGAILSGWMLAETIIRSKRLFNKEL